MEMLYFQEEMSDMKGRLEDLEKEWLEVDKHTDGSPEEVQAHLELVKVCKQIGRWMGA